MSKKIIAPTIFVIFGITGDLARGKLMPSLFDLFLKNRLPDKFHIVGFSRRDLSESEFRNFVAEVLEYRMGDSSKSAITEFTKRLSYIKGMFEDGNAYERLGQHLRDMDEGLFHVCTNKLFYLSVPPTFYETILTNLAHSGLTKPCSDEMGWTRVLVEKPFGSDMDAARRLDILLGKLFKEIQIFRIDHYLAKETLQNILAFRFSNAIFEPLWNNQYIERVDISLIERDTVETRGSFYDEVGALKDVGQNHLLQMLALVAMDRPELMFPQTIRSARAKVLANLKPMAKSEAISATVRGQYEGYQESLRMPGSQTETFFSLRAFVDDKRWKGVPFILTGGKGLHDSVSEIKIHFRDNDPASFLPKQFLAQERNQLIFSIKPEEKISLLFWVKIPGFENKIEPKKLTFAYREAGDMMILPDAYERVLHDCIDGDQTLFASTPEIEAQWNFVQSVEDAWRDMPLLIYKKGSEPSDIAKMAKLAAST